MAIKEFLHNHFGAHVCDNCHRHFPAYALVGFDYPFKGFNGRFCVVCCHKLYDLLGNCDECGEDYPKSHLFKSLTDHSVLCKNCLRGLHEDDPEDE